MKIRNLIIGLTSLLLLNSCIVKSLQPFYTKSAIAFQEAFVGKWDDGKDGYWNVRSFKEIAITEDLLGDKPNKENLEMYEAYKDGYIIEYTKKEKEAMFLAIPFKINNQLYIDFTPFSVGAEDANNLLSKHLLNTHSLVKFDILDNKNVNVSWLSESRIEQLMEDNQIRIKHERVGVMKDMVLTATSEELMAFVEKYSKSSIKDKWKSSSKYNLKRIDAKP